MPRKPRRAKLTIEQTAERHVRTMRPRYWCRLTGRNGEVQLGGETLSNGPRARAAIIRAMVDVIEDAGYVVAKAEEASR